MLHVLSAGAARGLVTRLQGAFGGAGLVGSFNAVGAIRERFVAGEACDVLILTAAQLAELAAWLDGPAVPVGPVRTAVAVPAGHPAPPIATAFAAALRAASALYIPDPVKSTAGRHVAAVLAALGLAPPLRTFPNGEAAMRALAEDALPGSLGSTQATEILATPGVTLVGPLPAEHALTTVYAAAVSAKAANPAEAHRLVALLTGPDTLGTRQACGFD